jgi:hypothetical protein
MAAKTFQSVLTEAIADFAEHGFDSPERLARWQQKLRETFEGSLTPDDVMERMLRDGLTALYRKMVDQGRLLEFHPGVERFTLEKVRPQLHAELTRRIMASADLIRLNREKMVAQTLQRFSGWATSIPKGGSDVVSKVEEKQKVKKGLASAPFEERRVLIDQGHKLVAALSEIVAVDNGAIAGKWFSHWRDPGYDARPQHKHLDVDGKLFVVRDNWALKAGLMKLAGAHYTDEIERPGELPFCRCRYIWIHHLRQLPDDMLTAKGRAALQSMRVVA